MNINIVVVSTFQQHASSSSLMLGSLQPEVNRVVMVGVLIGLVTGYKLTGHLHSNSWTFLGRNCMLLWLLFIPGAHIGSEKRCFSTVTIKPS